MPDLCAELASLDRRLRPALMAYFLRRLGNHAEAEDLTQEVFVRLASSRAGDDALADGYVFKVAGNLLKDRARRAKVRGDNLYAVHSLEGFGIDPLDPARIAADREAIAALCRGLDELDEPTRSIFVLYKLENAERHAIAATFGLSRQQLDRHLAKAMALLTARVRAGE